MRIATVEHLLPTRQVTNEELVTRIRQHNAARLSERDLAVLEGTIRRTLKSAGTEVRYYIEDCERPIDFAIEASRQALTRAGVAPAEVDFVIYASVSRGWTEPATAPVLQNALRLERATAFDVLDACAGWLRALHIAHAFIRGGTYRTGLIVTCECGVSRDAINWQFDGVDDLEHRLAACTIGEAATATIVSGTELQDDFHFTFRTAGQHFGLCVIPLPGMDGFVPGRCDERYVPGRLFSLSRALVDAVSAGIVELFDSDPLLHGPYDVAFGHEVSERVCETVARRLGVADVYFPTHRRYGNTVSGSVPLGMSTALRDGRLKRGNRVLIIIGASGVTVGFAAFTF